MAWYEIMNLYIEFSSVIVFQISIWFVIYLFKSISVENWYSYIYKISLKQNCRPFLLTCLK